MEKKYTFSLLLIAITVQTFSQVPTVDHFVPASGPVGTIVTITGTNFNPVVDNNIVFFGATRATVTTATATELTVTVPVGATYQPITLLNNGLMAYASKPFVVAFNGVPGINANAFSFKGNFGGTESTKTGDFDGDGKSDLVVIDRLVVNGRHVVSILRNTSSGPGIISFAEKVSLSSVFEPLSVSIADLDGDGKLDVAVLQGNDSVSVFRNASNGAGSISFADKIALKAGMDPFSMSTGDLDGDGKTEIIVTKNSSIPFQGTVSVFGNTSSGVGNISFAESIDFRSGRNSLSVWVGDLDDDDKAELVVINDVNTISVFHNISSGPGSIDFAPKLNFTTGSLPEAVVVGDMDEDGKADLAVANFGDNTVSVLRNTSTGPGNINFASKMDFVTGRLPKSVSMDDLDGDGKVDLAVGNYDSGVSLFRNISDGPGSINFATKVDIGNHMESVCIGDLDGDGKADLAMENGSLLSVWRNAILWASGPNISHINPSSGPYLTLVTITGSNFSITEGTANTVQINGTNATVIDRSTTSITIAVPEGATTGPVTVTVDGLTGVGADFTVFPCSIPEKPVITASNLDTTTPLLTSSSSIGNQWFLNGTPIDGAIDNTLTVTATGAYSVQVMVPGGCLSYMSDDFEIIITGNANEDIPNVLKVYPNPIKDEVIFETGEPGFVMLKLIDNKGRTIIQTQFIASKEVDTRQIQPGMYYFIVRTNKRTVSGKLFKK